MEKIDNPFSGLKCEWLDFKVHNDKDVDGEDFQLEKISGEFNKLNGIQCDFSVSIYLFIYFKKKMKTYHGHGSENSKFVQQVT